MPNASSAFSSKTTSADDSRPLPTPSIDLDRFWLLAARMIDGRMPAQLSAHLGAAEAPKPAAEAKIWLDRMMEPQPFFAQAGSEASPALPKASHAAWMACSALPDAQRLAAFRALCSQCSTAKDAHPRAFMMGLDCMASTGELAALAALPGFSPSRFDDPWIHAACAASASEVRRLREAGAPALGWRAGGKLPPSEWEALCHASSLPGIAQGAAAECAAELILSGRPAPDSRHLAHALEWRQGELADALELHGALPDHACAQASFKSLPPAPLPSEKATPAALPSARLLRWLSLGLLDPLEAIGQGRGAKSWGAMLFQAAGEAPQAQRASIARALALALSHSQLYATHDQASLDWMASGRPFAGHGRPGPAAWLMKASDALMQEDGLPPLDWAQPGSRQRLAQWWDAAALRASVRGAPSKGRPLAL